MHLISWKSICKPVYAGGLGPKTSNDKSVSEATSRADSAWTWKSVMHGTDLLLSGVDMQLWSNEQTSIQMEKDTQSILVKDLMCPIRQESDETIFRRNNPNEFMEDLKTKLCSFFRGRDKVVWKFNYDGTYIMKSGYSIATGEQGINCSRIINWTRLWKIQLPYKFYCSYGRSVMLKVLLKVG